MLKRLAREEQGIALVLALMVMTVLTIVTGTAIYYTTSSEHESSYSKASDTAYRLAQAGLNNAMAVLGGSNTNALSSSALPSSEATASSQTQPAGTVKWWGTFTSSTKQWLLYGEGLVTNPNSSNTQSVKRIVTATENVTYSYQQPVNAQAWNYVYIENVGGSSVCDMTLQQNVDLDAPLYLEGNLCFQNNSHLRQDLGTVTVNVVVKGTVGWASNSSSIGISSSNTVSQVYVANGCGSANSQGTTISSVHTCTTTGKSADPIYATSFSTTPPSVTPPSVNFASDGWYANADPGPDHPCAVTSGTPPSFDGGPSPHNTEQDIVSPYANGSISSTVNLTPSASYTCQTSGGELSWNASTHTLTVRGVIYIDGNVSIGDGSVDDYNGQATIYTSGWVNITGKMCGARLANNTDCDFSNWNPNNEMLIIAAHGNDGSGNSVYLANGARWEGGLYAVNAINVQNGATVEGPMIGGTVIFNQTAVAKPFPVITTLPAGAPGNPNVYAQPNPPSSYSG